MQTSSLHAVDACSPLLIKRVDAFKVRLPLLKPMLMSGVQILHADNLLVRMESRSGVVGWGEATAAPSHGGSTLDEMAHVFKQDIASWLAGKNAMRLSGITADLYRHLPKAASAAAAIDLALYDLVGQSLGLPAHMLLGGLHRETVMPLWLIGTSSVDGDLAEARKRHEEGYRFFKLKLGVKSLDEDIASTLALRDMLGPNVKLCADANTGMSAEQAIRYGEAVGPASVAYLEQPLKKDDIEGLRALVQNGSVAVGLDESVLSVHDILRYAPVGIKGVSLKTLKLGGISGVTASGAVCDALNLQINLAGKIAETSIASAALLQLAGVLPNVNWGASPSHLYLAQDVVRTPQVPEQGSYRISTLPGLGIEVDESVVSRFGI